MFKEAVQCRALSETVGEELHPAAWGASPRSDRQHRCGNVVLFTLGEQAAGTSVGQCNDGPKTRLLPNGKHELQETALSPAEKRSGIDEENIPFRWHR